MSEKKELIVLKPMQIKAQKWVKSNRKSLRLVLFAVAISAFLIVVSTIFIYAFLDKTPSGLVVSTVACTSALAVVASLFLLGVDVDADVGFFRKKATGVAALFLMIFNSIIVHQTINNTVPETFGFLNNWVNGRSNLKDEVKHRTEGVEKDVANLLDSLDEITLNSPIPNRVKEVDSSRNNELARRRHGIVEEINDIEQIFQKNWLSPHARIDRRLLLCRLQIAFCTEDWAEFEEIAAAWPETIQKDSLDLKYDYWVARQRFNDDKNSLDSVESLFQQINRLVPNDRSVLAMLGHVEIRRGNFLDAANYYQRCRHGKYHLLGNTKPELEFTIASFEASAMSVLQNERNLTKAETSRLDSLRCFFAAGRQKWLEVYGLKRSIFAIDQVAHFLQLEQQIYGSGTIGKANLDWLIAKIEDTNDETLAKKLLSILAEECLALDAGSDEFHASVEWSKNLFEKFSPVVKPSQLLVEKMVFWDMVSNHCFMNVALLSRSDTNYVGSDGMKRTFLLGEKGHRLTEEMATELEKTEKGIVDKRFRRGIDFRNAFIAKIEI